MEVDALTEDGKPRWDSGPYRTKTGPALRAQVGPALRARPRYARFSARPVCVAASRTAAMIFF